MKPTLLTLRLFFLIVSTLIMVGYVSSLSAHPTPSTLLLGSLLGLSLCGTLIGIDLLIHRFSLASFNTLTLGLFFGSLLGTVLLFFINSLITMGALPFTKESGDLVKILSFLGSAYLGIMITFRYASEMALSIPFIRLNESGPCKIRELLLDISLLADGRIVDIASTGLLDKRIAIPRFVMKELYEMAESKEETILAKGNFALEVVKRLEMIPNLHLHFIDTDFPEIKGIKEKMVSLARLINADLLTSDNNPVEMNLIDGVRVINLQSLACALKPLMHKGNFLSIKIQRIGKEDRQGVGYLDDGTMVVINGGGDYLGETIKTSVLSVKHTSAGRMIFCNVAEE